jgi:quinoprotein glucose dehydrogenase
MSSSAAAAFVAVSFAAVAAACSRAPDDAAATPPSAASPQPPLESSVSGDAEWPVYGSNLAAQRYSALDSIDRDNVASLRVAWRFDTGNFGPRPEQRNETTPLLIDGVLYTTVGHTRNVVAIDPASGEMLWLWRPNDGEER